MKIKSWLKYFVYIILILGLVYLNIFVSRKSTEYFKRTFHFSVYLLYFNMFINVGIGLLFGLELLINETKKYGKWKINIPKLIVLGLPSLYFSIAYILSTWNNEALLNIIGYPILLFKIYGTSYISVFQIILGYVIITSFFKRR